MKLLKRLKSLDSRGISHIALPLLAAVLIAVAGSASLVASHANAASKKHTTNTKKSSIPKPGYLVIYSAGGQYNSVRIRLVGTPSFPHQCNTSITPTLDVIKPLPTPATPKNGGASAAVKFLKLGCSPVSNNGAYQITLGKNRNFNSPHAPTATVDIDTGYCTLVHPGHNDLDSKFQADAKGNCPGADTAVDPPIAINVVVNVKPKVNTKTKSVTGYIEVKDASGDDMTRAQCTGQITAQFTSVGSDKIVASGNLPLKYTKPASGSSYCVAKLTKVTLAPGNYVEAGFENGTAYFNPGHGSAQVNIPVPVAKKKAAHKKTSTKKTNSGGASTQSGSNQYGPTVTAPPQ